MRLILPFIFIIFLYYPLNCTAQEMLNLIQSRQESKEFLEWIELVEQKNTKKLVFPKNPSDVLKKKDHKRNKKILAMGFFARFNNPVEYFDKSRNYLKMMKERKQKRVSINYQLAEQIFYNRDLFRIFDYKNKHILFDLFVAPYIFIGKVIKSDTVLVHSNIGCEVIKYEFEISDIINDLLDFDGKNKKTIFLFSTCHLGFARSQHETSEYMVPEYLYDIPFKSNDFVIGKEYLVFISNRQPNLKELPNPEDRHLPLLKISAYGDANFPIENSQIIDEYNYFGKGNYVDISEIKKLFDGIIADLKIWKDNY